MAVKMTGAEYKRFLTAAHLMHKYGPLLTEEQLGEVLHMEPGTIRNQRGSGALGIPFIKE